jgi:hypothetical protein
MNQVAVLFARADSIYKSLPGVDVWDIARDATKWPGGCPVVAHPPCRMWGDFKHFAKAPEGEKGLGLFAVECVRQWGGVLEHPKRSGLWEAAGLPAPGRRDVFNGWTLGISQHWWGHRAEKLTLLYIVGVEPGQEPEYSMQLDEAGHVIGQDRRARPDLGRGRLRKGMPGWRPEVTAREREMTPPLLAAWLVELARRCHMVGSRHQRKGLGVLLAPEACIGSQLSGQLPMCDASYTTLGRP